MRSYTVMNSTRGTRKLIMKKLISFVLMCPRKRGKFPEYSIKLRTQLRSFSLKMFHQKTIVIWLNFREYFMRNFSRSLYQSFAFIVCIEFPKYFRIVLIQFVREFLRISSSTSPICKINKSLHLNAARYIQAVEVVTVHLSPSQTENTNPPCAQHWQQQSDSCASEMDKHISRYRFANWKAHYPKFNQFWFMGLRGVAWESSLPSWVRYQSSGLVFHQSSTGKYLRSQLASYVRLNISFRYAISLSRTSV